MSGSKIKLLKVLDLINETDENHPYSTQYMADRLTDEGIDTERKAVLRDLYTLRDEYDLSIEGVRKKGFFLSERNFPARLSLLNFSRKKEKNPSSERA